MTNKEAISVIENEIQIDVRLCTDEQVDRFQTALYMAISALRAEPTGDSLTLEQLWEMDGQPVYCGDRKEWGVIHIDPDGPWEDVPFFRGVYCDLDVQHNGLTLYAYPPAHIDREAWEPCEECEKKNCDNCLFSEYLSSMEPCKSCCSAKKWKPISRFCSECGRPLTEEAWAELEKRMGVR